MKLLLKITLIILITLSFSFCKEQKSKINDKTSETTNKKVDIKSPTNKKFVPPTSLPPKMIGIKKIASRLSKFEGYKGISSLKYYNKKNLSDILNGEAGVYTSLDFVKLGYLNLMTNPSAISVFIFDMGNPISSYSIFMHEIPKNIEDLKIAYKGALIKNKSQSTLSFCKERFYIKFQCHNPNDKLIDIMKNGAEKIDNFIENTHNPIDDIISIFPNDKSIDNTFQYYRADFLGLDVFEHCFTQEYTFKNKNDEEDIHDNIFIAIFKDDTNAKITLGKYRRELEAMDGKIKKPLDLAYPGYFAKNGENKLEYIIVYKNYIIGIVGIEDEQTGVKIFKEMKKNIDSTDLSYFLKLPKVNTDIQ